jgi:hypothetical protein
MAPRLRISISVLIMAFLLAFGPVRMAAAQGLSELYLFDELFPIMAAEGIASAGDDGATPLDPSELGAWRRDLEQIYDATQMQASFTTALDAALQGRDDIITDASEFARTSLGERVLQLEVTARAALLDDTIDEMARQIMIDARDAPEGSAMAKRLALVRERISVNNLVELNVSLGLNTSYAYYMGMLSQTDLPGLGAQDVLSLVWAQEDAIRTDVTDWIESYFLMAYQPMTDDELQTYIDWSATPLGDAFNRAMFQAFDAVFVDISKRVGTALGRALSGQSL